MRADDVIAEQPTMPSGSGAVADGDRLEEGARAGDYEIEQLVGAGAMGEVYAARHPLIGKRAAVKVIKRHLATSPEAVERFLREARAVNQVGHANVVDVFAVGRLDDGRLYLVMDLLEGESLAARLRRGPPRGLPIGEALRILEAVAEALDAAHARGVVHRDLKPDNVFLAEGRVFVLDFGIAKLLQTDDAAAPGTLTDRGTWLGTPAYMAPEQWGADGAGPASDRYALGAIGFEVLAGRPPFAAASLPQMMEQHFRAPVPSLATGALPLPAAVDTVLARALAKDPDARFPSARGFVAALREALGTVAGPRAGAAATRAGIVARAGARPALVLGLGGATAVAALATGWVLFHGEPARPAITPSPSRDRAGTTVEVTSVPAGARVTIGGVDRGATPLALPLDELGDGAVQLMIARPGYAAATRRLDPTAPAPVRVSLTPVTRFEGVWALPDGELRAFERRGEQVAMFQLRSATGERRFERFFEFAPSDAGEIAFTASEEQVDERAPDEPSCHVRLAAEYVYDVERDALERRQERAQIDFAAGRCALRARSWGEAVALRRLSAAEETDWIESTAGAGNPKIDEPLVPQVPVPDETDKKGPPRKKTARVKTGPTPAKQVQPSPPAALEPKDALKNQNNLPVQQQAEPQPQVEPPTQAAPPTKQ